MDALEYETAAEELTIAAIDAGASDDERVEANLYAGMAHRILNRDVDAKLNFVYVLKHRPKTQLPAGTSPKIRNFFELVRQEVELNRIRHEAAPANDTTTQARRTEAAVTPKLPANETSIAPSSGNASFLPLVGGGVAAGGIGLLLLGGAGAAGAEVALGRREVSSTNKELAFVAFYGAVGTAVVGAVALGLGATLLLVSAE